MADTGSFFTTAVPVTHAPPVKRLVCAYCHGRPVAALTYVPPHQSDPISVDMCGAHALEIYQRLPAAAKGFFYFTDFED